MAESLSGIIKLQTRIVLLEMANDKIGKWLSAALDDPTVCAEMKADIRCWFSAWNPAETTRGILMQLGGDMQAQSETARANGSNDERRAYNRAAAMIFERVAKLDQ